jgi:hypothetical protein
MTLLYVVVNIAITRNVLLYGSSLLVIIRTNYVKAFVHPKMVLRLWIYRA